VERCSSKRSLIRGRGYGTRVVRTQDSGPMVNTWVEFAVNGAREEDRNNMAVIWILLGMPTSFDGEHLTQSILSDPLMGGNERSAEGRTSGAMTSCVTGVVLKSGSKGRS
jgi:hypothetical protein